MYYADILVCNQLSILIIILRIFYTELTIHFFKFEFFHLIDLCSMQCYFRCRFLLEVSFMGFSVLV